MINLLEESEKLNIIREGTNVGNTTRQVDLAFDLLHQGKTLIIEDHSKNIGNSFHLLLLIGQRLDLMYKHLFNTKVKLKILSTSNQIVVKLENSL
jgi:hypothetical protein